MLTALKIKPPITPPTHRETTVKLTGNLTLAQFPATFLRLPTRKFTVQSIQSEPSISSPEFTSFVGSPSLQLLFPFQFTLSQRHITALNIAAFSWRRLPFRLRGCFAQLYQLFCFLVQAFKRAAESLEKLMDVAREDLPGTMAAIRLSGMEISDLTMELRDMGFHQYHEIYLHGGQKKGSGPIACCLTESARLTSSPFRSARCGALWVRDIEFCRNIETRFGSYCSQELTKGVRNSTCSVRVAEERLCGFTNVNASGDNQHQNHHR